MRCPADGDTRGLRQFVQSNDELLANFCWIENRVHFAVHDIVEELAILSVLHDHEYVVGCFDDLVELCDGGMPD